MECFKCKYYKEDSNRNFTCLSEIRQMDITCLMRHFLWGQIRMGGLRNKAEKMIDKLDGELKEGEEWKE